MVFDLFREGLRQARSESNVIERTKAPKGAGLGNQYIEVDRGWDRIVKGTKQLSGDTVVAGIRNETWKTPESGFTIARQESSTEGKPLQIAKIAFWHEFGTTQHSAKSFFRESFDANVDDYVEIGLDGYRRWQMGWTDIVVPLKKIGFKMQRDIKSFIRQKDLIDTAQMISAVSYNVVEGRRGSGGVDISTQFRHWRK